MGYWWNIILCESKIKCEQHFGRIVMINSFENAWNCNETKKSFLLRFIFVFIIEYYLFHPLSIKQWNNAQMKPDSFLPTFRQLCRSLQDHQECIVMRFIFKQWNEETVVLFMAAGADTCCSNLIKKLQTLPAFWGSTVAWR